MRGTIKIFQRDDAPLTRNATLLNNGRLLPMPLPPPLIVPGNGELPVLLSVPHAGRDYPDWLLHMANGGRRALHVLEDPLVDRLVEPAIAGGIGAVIARAPRAAVDCNRAEDEIDPTVIRSGPLQRLSPRARGGLGIIPGRTAAHGALWRRPVDLAELERRIGDAHRPYHQALERELAALLDRFGCALLLDCHSMPTPQGGAAPIILGDRHGRSAGAWVTAEAVKTVASTGYRVGVNEPFAGGYILQRHGSPETGVHALQVEIDRGCYLAGCGTQPGAGFEAAARLIERLALRLGEFLLDRRFAAAAE
jgi:N-formylglutamate amidohydrolase